MNIQKSLKNAIEKRGITRKELCSKAKVTNPYITWILQGKHKPNITTIERIASALDMSVIEFLHLGE
jgi:transcriptional regulator with XRE-family HTH domain